MSPKNGHIPRKFATEYRIYVIQNAKMKKKERKIYNLELKLSNDEKTVTYELIVSFDILDNDGNSLNNKE